MSRNPVSASLADPYQLELLYRENPDEFIRWFKAALAMHPKAQILQFWQARLRYRPESDLLFGAFRLRQISLLLLACSFAFALVKLPWMLSLDIAWFELRFAPLILVGALCLYLHVSDRQPSIQLLVPGIGLSFFALVYGTLRGDLASDSVVMALIHGPLAAWFLFGYVFLEGQWRDTWRRIDFIRFNGELFILSLLILMGGVVLTGLTIGLFGLINLDIEQWYVQNVAVLGIVSAPLVATFVFSSVLNRQGRFAVVIANVFTPLFLVTVVAYLLAMLIAQRSPYSDREFLIVFNGLLLLVLAMTVFSIAGKDPDRPSAFTDLVNKALLSVTLLVDVVALSAMIYRLAEGGLTPNRLVVTGVNALVFAHLLLIITAYLGLRLPGGRVMSLNRATVGYLPVYALWALAVIVFLPPLFGYR